MQVLEIVSAWNTHICENCKTKIWLWNLQAEVYGSCQNPHCRTLQHRNLMQALPP